MVADEQQGRGRAHRAEGPPPAWTRIARIEPFPLEFRLPAPQGNAIGLIDRRACLVVRVTSEDGVVGWGETWWRPRIAAACLEREIAPAVLGACALDRERLFHGLYHRSVGYERQGSWLAALSALDIALWDLAGKALGLPLARLLGGVFRDRIEAYASGPFLPPDRDPAAHAAAEVAAYAEAGFRVVKMRVGLAPEVDLRMVEAVRAAVGDAVRLAVDFNQAYDRQSALRSLRALEPFHLLFAEEPVAPDDGDGYRHLRRHLAVPLAGGETEATAFAFRRLIAAEVLDILQPDVAIAGGLSECLRIRHLAEAWRLGFVPHVWGSAISAAATLHLLAAMPPYAPCRNPVQPLLEWDRSPNPFREELLTRPIAFDGRFALIPDGPGLGIEVDEAILRRFAAP